MVEIDWRDTPSGGDTIANTGANSFEEMANLLQDWEAFFDGTDVYLPTGANLLVNSVNPKRTIVLSVGGGHPSTTNGAGIVQQREYSVNKQSLYIAGFDSVTKEYYEWTFIMPDNYDGGDLYGKFHWTHGSTTTNFGVCFGIQMRAYTDSDPLDQVWGTAKEIVDTGGTSGDYYVSGETTAITPAGSPSGGQLMQVRVYRDPANASDNMAIDADLIAVTLKYGVNAYSD